MNGKVEQSMSISRPLPPHYSGIEKISILLGSLGLLLLLVALLGQTLLYNFTWLIVSIGLMSAGTIAFSVSRYLSEEPGIKNDGVWFSSLTSKGVAAWILGIVLTGFYCFLYWKPEALGLKEGGNTGLVGFFDPLSRALKGEPASEWFVYGTLYTLAILIFGIKFILKYRHNRYQVIRTLSVMFFQLAFAYLIPEIMASFNMPYNDFKNMWPLNYYFFFDWNIKQMLAAGTFGLFMLIWGIVLFLVISPILTYFFGKRWYCSWVCGCGGLAETAGDPFRQLSDKSTKAWKIERWMIHSVLVFAVVMTVAVLFTFFHQEPNAYWLNKTSFSIIVLLLCAMIAGFVFSRRAAIRESFKNLDYIIWGILALIAALTLIALLTGAAHPFFIDAYRLREWYGFLIGAAFSGVIGVGFYPILGSRVWCRYGCPLAAILGVQQKFFSKFRITTNGGQCISCGNCSTYCEMGIDVRAYAQKGQNIVRASCVGCGICAAVCPRGVLKLENGSIDIFKKTVAKRTVHVKEEDVFVKF